MLNKFLKIFSWVLVLALVLTLLYAPLSPTWASRVTYMLIGAVLHGITTLKHARRAVFILIGLLLFIILLLQTDLVQNYILDKVTTKLSEDLKTKVAIKHISFSFFDKVDLNGVLVLDQKNDTLLSAGTLKLRITDWFFLKDSTDLKYIGLEDAKINLERTTDSVWNYMFIADHFALPGAKKDTSKKVVAFNIQKIDLKKVTFIQNDEWRGQKMTARVGSLLADIKTTDLGKSEFRINSVDIDKPYFSLEDFDGNRPAPPPFVKDTGMYFNSGDISMRIADLKITDGTFASIKRGDVPEKGLFDGAYIKLNKIDGTFKQLSFIKDTIKAKVDLTATERSGLELKKLKSL